MILDFGLNNRPMPKGIFATRLTGSKAFFPVAGSPVPVGNGQHLDDRLFFPIDNRKGKALQDEFPRCVLTARPASG